MKLYDQIKSILRVKTRANNTETFISFKGHIEKLIEIISPNNILEFGPGTSTKLFLNNSDASILSFETNEYWYSHYNKKFISQNRVKLVFKQNNGDLNEIYNYSNNMYDIIFIDGGNRIEELWFVKKILDGQGVVFLHDAHRNDYYWGIKQYKHAFFIEKHSCLLMDNDDLFTKLKTKITPDLSCSCEYCSDSKYRQVYLDEFISVK